MTAVSLGCVGHRVPPGQRQAPTVTQASWDPVFTWKLQLYLWQQMCGVSRQVTGPPPSLRRSPVALSNQSAPCAPDQHGLMSPCPRAEELGSFYLLSWDGPGGSGLPAVTALGRGQALGCRGQQLPRHSSRKVWALRLHLTVILTRYCGCFKSLQKWRPEEQGPGPSPSCGVSHACCSFPGGS